MEFKSIRFPTFNTNLDKTLEINEDSLKVRDRKHSSYTHVKGTHYSITAKFPFLFPELRQMHITRLLYEIPLGAHPQPYIPVLQAICTPAHTAM